MAEHSVFPTGKENKKDNNDDINKLLDETANIKVENNSELVDLMVKFLENPKLKSTINLTKEQIFDIALLTTLAESIKEKVKSTINEIRDELISIRTLADENPMKSKQKLTNLIKELK